jgi:4-carboxymuconolactone decarboxylase
MLMHGKNCIRHNVGERGAQSQLSCKPPSNLIILTMSDVLTTSNMTIEEHLHHILEESEVLFPHEQALILAAAAAALNETPLLKEIVRMSFAYNTTNEALYEALLQTYLFAGFPAALEGLAVLRIVCRETNRDFTPPPAENISLNLFQERGTILCEQIYTSAYVKMRQNLAATSPDLASWMILEGYGKTLARPELAPRMRELAICGVLAVLGWKTQLYSHLRGAMNMGATPIECMDTLKMMRFFAHHASPFMRPVIQERLTMANEVLSALLDTSSSL